MSYFLSICIPTYNGGENLKYNINKLIKMQPEYGFEICVSDNASDDGTQEFMTIAANEYKFIKYHRNKENMGIAYNFDYVLNMASSEYRWLLGDDDEIVEENLGKVIRALKENRPDICVVNGGTIQYKYRVKNIETRLFKDKNAVLSILGEHMTWMSCLVMSKTFVSKVNIRKVTNNAFPHLIEVFKVLDKYCNLLWIYDSCVYMQINNQNRYSEHYLDYFIKDWVGITEQIGNYSQEAKSNFCKVGEQRLFSFKSILSLRARNIINDNNVEKCRIALKSFSRETKYTIYLVNILPLSVFKILYKLYKFLKGVKNEENISCTFL